MVTFYRFRVTGAIVPGGYRFDLFDGDTCVATGAAPCALDAMDTLIVAMRDADINTGDDDLALRCAETLFDLVSGHKEVAR